jgi:shikimate dehydrogenase
MSVRLFGLIGYPLTHSFSGKYFAEKFRNENISDSEYRNFPLEKIEQLPELLNTHPELRGFNVTIPYKEAIIPFLDEIDETAKEVGAVNTVVCQTSAEPVSSEAERLSLTNNKESNLSLTNKSLRLIGYNTDVYGFRQSIKPFLASQHERALILGTGGASKAVEYVLRTIGVECVFVSRSAFDSTQSDNTTKRTILRYSDLNEHVMAMCKFIVNCSPVGTFPNINEAPAIPYEYITSDHFLYDLVYNPAETEFLRRGKERGAMIQNGYDMLKMQAEKAWEYFNSES